MANKITMQQLTQQIQQALSAGQGEKALKIAQGALRTNSEHPQLRHMLGAVYVTLGRTEQARKEFKKVLDIAPNEPRVMIDYALACRSDRLFDEGHEMLDRALAIQPGGLQLLACKADLLFLDARYNEAADFLREQGETLEQPHPGILLTQAKVCSAANRLGEARSALEQCLEFPDLPQPVRTDALFRLAKLQDAEGDYETAFQTAAEANKLRQARFDTNMYQGLVDETIKAWTPEQIASFPTAADSGSDRAVFVLGMPRSGTSLVEQLLASHPEVFGGGEIGDIGNIARQLQGMFAFDPPLLSNLSQLSSTNLKSASHGYIERLRKAAPDATRVTDKMHLNFLHLGLISLITPKARIIHCRRDPVDTCLSCYFHNFSGSSAPFAYDLKSIGHFYQQYERLMAHWAKVLELQILEVAYEDMVADAEEQGKRLLEFLDLDWNEDCLKFHEPGQVTMAADSNQARLPIYSTSLNRRGNYENLIGDLTAALSSG